MEGRERRSTPILHLLFSILALLTVVLSGCGPTKQEIKFMKQKDVSSTRNALRVSTLIFPQRIPIDPSVKVTVSLKFLLPTGDWMTLGSAELPALSERWQKYSIQMISAGQTDQAVFELRASGEGNLWADKLSLMPGDNLRGWRSDVIEAVKGVRPALIRWGGSSIDPGHYRWKNAIGDRDLRAPWRNENWGRIDSNDVGIDEFCQF